VACEIVKLTGANVPVEPGAASPLPASGPLPPENEAVAFLAGALRHAPTHIAAIGPLTNLGLLVHHHPDVLDRILSVVAVAGRSEDEPFDLGDAESVQDFNFERDPRAAQLLLESGVPVVLAGFELTSQVAVTERDLETIRKAGTATAEYFHRNSLAWCRHWVQTFPADQGFHPWDSAAIAWLRHPEYFVTQSRGWRVRDVAYSGSRSADGSYRQEDASPNPGSHGLTTVPWLECDEEYPGNQVTYCTGFSPGGAAAFVRDVVTTVY
jgi:inosine-uridine nucleoside N-ribohydrolase